MKFIKLFTLFLLINNSTSCAKKIKTLHNSPKQRLALRNKILSRMTLDEKIGQVFLISIPGMKENKKNLSLLEKIKPGGIIFFKYNFGNSQDIWKWLHKLQRRSLKKLGIPVLLTTDQEYGRVKRLTKNMTLFPSAMALGASKDLSLTQKAGFIIASELGAYGININLAPVADVNNNPRNPVIKQRSFGSESNNVSNHVNAYIKGFHQGGLACVAKHFPGHGDTDIDSHIGLPVIKKNISELLKMELIPFQNAIQKNVDGIMTAHILFQNLDAKLPATLSPFILTKILRDKLKFPGFIITDDMDMGAIVKNYYYDRKLKKKINPAIQALKAGADILIFTGKFFNTNAAFSSLKEAVQNGVLLEKLLNEKVARILDAKINIYFGKKPLSPLESQKILTKRKDILKKTFSRGVSLLWGDKKILQEKLIQLQSKKEIALFPYSRTTSQVAQMQQIPVYSRKNPEKILSKSFSNKKLIILESGKHIPSVWKSIYRKAQKNPKKNSVFMILIPNNPFEITSLKNSADFILTTNGNLPGQLNAFFENITQKGVNFPFITESYLKK